MAPKESRLEDTPLRAGIDYDLVNISLIGHDPVSGRSYEECNEEWHEALNRVQALVEDLKWWQLRRRFKIAKKLSILDQRQGMGFR